MSQFKFSIITVVKNDEKNLEKTIMSILDQKNFDEIEYIIIDGKSDDNTLKIIEKYKHKIHKIISEKDDGIYDAMNKGIKLSRGKIIGMCNSGDIIYSNGIEYVKKQFQNNCDFVFGTVLRKYLGTEIIKHGYNPKRIYYNFDFATSHSTGFYIKREIIEKIGYYDTQFKCSSDYDFYLRMIKSGMFKGSFTKADELVGEVQSGGYSSSISFYEHLKEETKIRIKNKQNKILIILIFVNAIIKNFLKKI